MAEVKAKLAEKIRSRPSIQMEGGAVRIGNVLIKRLGTIVHDRPAYHSRRYAPGASVC